MTRKSNILGTMALFVVALISGCASPPKGSLLVSNTSDLPPIQAQYSHQLSQIKIGMNLQEFRQVFPEAHILAQDGNSTTYELVGTQSYVSRGDIFWQNFWWGFGSPKARTITKSIYFYFFDDELVKWSNPKEVSHEPITKESDEQKK